MINNKSKLETEPYKGVRDFYPEDTFIENYIFDIWRKTVLSFGFEEYNSSILEPSEIYESKTSEEIVNEQTYSFTDRGERKVTLRPEMTPTVARMVAAKKGQLNFPLRWFSIANFFRYEKPQKGRLREFWQLNADIFGLAGIQAEKEVIMLCTSIMNAFGAKENDFEIRINSRKVMNYILKVIFELNGEEIKSVSRLIDKKDKMESGEFRASLEGILKDRTDVFIRVLNSDDLNVAVSGLKDTDQELSGFNEVKMLMSSLEKSGIKNIIFSPTLMRGFDYYTGIVFEIFDKNPKNRRALFGGGRYDDLLSLWGNETIPAFGFGMGDVTIKDFLETHGLMPEYRSSTDLCIAAIDEKNMEKAEELANFLRKNNLNISVDLTSKRIGDKIKSADKKKIPFVLVFGEEEENTGKYKVKNLKSGEEKITDMNGIKQTIGR